jgi:hypothetical protein
VGRHEPDAPRDFGDGPPAAWMVFKKTVPLPPSLHASLSQLRPMTAVAFLETTPA